MWMWFLKVLKPNIRLFSPRRPGFESQHYWTFPEEMLKGSQAKEYLVYLGKKQGMYDKKSRCEDLGRQQVGS